MRLSLVCCLALSCARSVSAPPAPSGSYVDISDPELLQRLRKAIDEIVRTDEQDREHERIAREVSRRRLFVGRSLREIRNLVGNPELGNCGDCLRHVHKLVITVGRLPHGYLGETAEIAIEVSPDGICTGMNVYEER
jgi:hypothetical protein